MGTLFRALLESLWSESVCILGVSLNTGELPSTLWIEESRAMLRTDMGFLVEDHILPQLEPLLIHDPYLF